MKIKEFIIKGLVILIISVLPLSTFNYVIDPYQFYRKADNPIFFQEQRHQNPGLAKNYKSNLAIIGTSLTENFLPEYVGQKFNKKAIKLSMSAASAHEENMILQLAINNNEIDTVIWGLELASLRGSTDRVSDEQSKFPYHLYDNNKLNDYKYLLSTETFKRSIMVLLSNSLNKNFIGQKDLNKLNIWYDKFIFSEEQAYSSWNNRHIFNIDTNDYSWDKIKANLDKNVISIIKKYPNINFKIFYPPNSVLTHKFFDELGIFDEEQKYKEYLFMQCRNLKNVEIYDFQYIEKIILNLDNYKDMSHYSLNINEFIIDSIINKKYLITDYNIKENLNKLNTIVKNYKIKK